jgi:type I restriction-modification system DNA methylase subunit
VTTTALQFASGSGSRPAPGAKSSARKHYAPPPSNAKQPTIGKLIDEAMAEIEKANPGLKGVLPKDYNRPALDKVMLGELIDLISGIAMGEPNDKAKDILGRRRAVRGAVRWL